MKNKRFILPSLLLTLIPIVLGREIKNEQGLIKFAKEANNAQGCLRYTVNLKKDINMKNKDTSYFPINNFCGTFDGEGHTIFNLHLERDNQTSVGLFGKSEGMILKNIAIDKTCVFKTTDDRKKGDNYGGVISDCENCEIKNVLSSASILIENTGDGTGYCGGIVGKAKGSKMTNTLFNGHVSCKSTINYAGGIAGHAESKSTMENCESTGTISHFPQTETYVGGIVGYIKGTDSSISNCLVMNSPKFFNSSKYHSAGITGISGTRLFGLWGIKITNSICFGNNKMSTSYVRNVNSSGHMTFTESKIRKVLTTLNTNQDEQWTWVLVDLNGGKIDGVNADKVLIPRYFIENELIKPTRSKVEFLSYSDDKNEKFKAKWKAQVTLKADDGTTVTDSVQKAIVGENIMSMIKISDKVGHRFKCLGVSVGECDAENMVMPAKPLTLYLSYEKMSYFVTYKSQNGNVVHEDLLE